MDFLFLPYQFFFLYHINFLRWEVLYLFDFMDFFLGYIYIYNVMSLMSWTSFSFSFSFFPYELLIWEVLYPFWFSGLFFFFFFFYVNFFKKFRIYIYTHTWLFDEFFHFLTYCTVFWFSLSFYLHHLPPHKYVFVYSFFFFFLIKLNRFYVFVAFFEANFLKFDIFYMLMVWESMIKYC